MRTKALLLAAAFAAAGVATSMAQAVYSVNAVGYVNTTLVPGFQLVANPLNAADNKLETLFNNMQGGVRDGTTVYKFNNGAFKIINYIELLGSWSGDLGETTLPGDGVFVYLPPPGAGEAANKVVTFVGEVPQNSTTTPVPKGFSIKSSVVPQAIAPDQTKNTDASPAPIPATDGNVLYRYLPAQKNYDIHNYIQLLGGWDPALPVINVGEAFYYYNAGDPTTWNRTFSVNNPQ